MCSLLLLEITSYTSTFIYLGNSFEVSYSICATLLLAAGNGYTVNKSKAILVLPSPRAMECRLQTIKQWTQHKGRVVTFKSLLGAHRVGIHLNQTQGRRKSWGRSLKGRRECIGMCNGFGRKQPGTSLIQPTQPKFGGKVHGKDKQHD